MTRKKTTFIFTGITIILISILILSFNLLTKFNHLNQNKTEEIIEKHQEWMQQIITSTDTISILSKQKINSINNINVKQDSLLKKEQLNSLPKTK
ncbi:hypothetical protein Q4553_12000 [Tenacibaculum soleae]|uniref:hypothetical protein n=1 Tax=Tenacibaculum soleae TaxID=447689 RepID=UPI0026E182C3|nr:hypothetical protein [Tenacibaculum soleae]MDO6745298.1 hypothetical protein [Tenacibaculum soleae]